MSRKEHDYSVFYASLSSQIRILTLFQRSITGVTECDILRSAILDNNLRTKTETQCATTRLYKIKVETTTWRSQLVSQP
eukprot:1345549-Amorphochlora_amoeboformis.AAC.1